ncbi:hypothetical protein [Thauera aromatica]|uniref:hypothetical protein n=1 Tax=Thauera aromatica TaxID=59405 RepID=UPI001FFCB0AC|nr:hypothetical protein [Thauera aromatica]MCK2097632.1 hypothetical protein [Thauera aromatica]
MRADCPASQPLIRRILLVIAVGLACFGAFLDEGRAFWGSTGKALSAIAMISTVSHALPEGEIVRLARLAAETKGTIRVGEELGRLNLPNEVLEDAFLRIAVHQGRILRAEAEGMFSRLTGVPGFRTTLRKVVGNSEVGTAGHLYELRLADSAAGRGIKVLGIGEKFDDGLKQAPTDIDVLLQHRRTTFAIEAKNYAPSTMMPLDRYRADLDSLVAYRRENGNQVVPIFSMSNRPEDARHLKLLQHEAKKRQVELIFGSAEESVEQIKLLGELR